LYEKLNTAAVKPCFNITFIFVTHGSSSIPFYGSRIVQITFNLLCIFLLNINISKLIIKILHRSLT